MEHPGVSPRVSLLGTYLTYFEWKVDQSKPVILEYLYVIIFLCHNKHIHTAVSQYFCLNLFIYILVVTVAPIESWGNNAVIFTVLFGV